VFATVIFQIVLIENLIQYSMTITLPIVILFSLSSAVFAAGGFYMLTNWRIKRLEEREAAQQDIRERLVRIETMIQEIKERE
jgi:hypothetical protein